MVSLTDLFQQLRYLVLEVLDMLILVVDQILTVLVTHARQRPEESACSYFVELYQIVIYQALVDIFDCLEHDSFLSAYFLDFLKIKNLFTFVVNVQNFLPLLLKTQTFFPHLNNLNTN